MTPDSLDPLETSAREVSELLKRFESAAKDARVSDQSVEGRYVDAYTAGFLLAKVVVRASRYRVRGGENHRDTLRAVPWLVGSDAQTSVDAGKGASRVS